jgi:hypothetical protein
MRCTATRIHRRRWDAADSDLRHSASDRHIESTSSVTEAAEKAVGRWSMFKPE